MPKARIRPLCTFPWISHTDFWTLAFLKDGLIIETLGETCKGGSDCSCKKQHSYEVTLNVSSHCVIPIFIFISILFTCNIKIFIGRVSLSLCDDSFTILSGFMSIVQRLYEFSRQKKLSYTLLGSYHTLAKLSCFRWGFWSHPPD